jgi:nitrite reductase/ring-hydroxylating ferredoxin subunit
MQFQTTTTVLTDDTQTIVVVADADLHDGMSHTFRFQRDDETMEGFVIRHNGQIHAYINLCPHAGEPIADGKNSAFNTDKRYLICREHFALFDPETGKCVSGPCPIRDLFRLHAKVENGNVVVVVTT